VVVVGRLSLIRAVSLFALYPLFDHFWRPPMFRTIALLAALLILSAISATTWIALQPPLETLVVPGATNV
jgi:hypothetical protein